MFYAFIGCFGALSALILTVMGFKLMQILQLSSYRMRGVIDWLKSTKLNWIVRYFAVAFFSVAAMIVYVGCFGLYKYVAYIGLLFYLLFTLLFIFLSAKQKSVTPLKFTPRIVRLCILDFVLAFLASAALLYVSKFIRIRYSLLGLLPLCVPLLTALAYYILLPFEMLNNHRYISKATKKLGKNSSLIKVGITGSYGKTTAKNILAAMLSAKYNVLYSPSSYNTPLGIARVVNYELNDEHQVFIAEMGARHRGDIAELAKLVRPDVGVVTAVGAQHLATFKSLETICDTKYELVEGIKTDGFAAFSSDNEYTKAMYAKTSAVEKIIAGAAGEENALVSYIDVTFGEEGTSFVLTCGDKSEKVTTRLLGRHVPTLVSLCAAVAVKLNVDFADITEAVRNLEPVEHRLQMLGNGDVTVLDDAYNSNAAGAANALEVLKSFEGTKIVITPGLVEMGNDEEEANRSLGAQVGAIADYAYFVGSRAQWLAEGAVSAGMSEERVRIFTSRDDAVAATGEITGRKVILFENDLPDNL